MSQPDLGLPLQYHNLYSLIQKLLRVKKLLIEERLASPEFQL
jgi:hypothetical protein